jgi:hypothetical protein
MNKPLTPEQQTFLAAGMMIALAKALTPAQRDTLIQALDERGEIYGADDEVLGELFHDLASTLKLGASS